ncbi:hypothetical protein C8J56DRAFT_924649 [Mycena floridula]|nr:hypothetical protein C8J56DRAFT_924649 [Mycena floridula]
MIHSTHRTREYWKHIPGYKDRQMCKHCGITESMEHILVDARDPNWPKIDFGTIMGCGPMKIFSTGQKVDKGKTQLFQLIVSEQGALLW